MNFNGLLIKGSRQDTSVNPVTGYYYNPGFFNPDFELINHELINPRLFNQIGLKLRGERD